MTFGYSLESASDPANKLSRLLEACESQIQQFSSLDTMNDVTTLVIPVCNESKILSSTLDNVLQITKPQVAGNLHILLVCNGCKDTSVDVAIRWADHQDIPLRTGKNLINPPSFRQRRSIALDIIEIPVAGETIAYSKVGDLFKSWGKKPEQFICMDADTRMTQNGIKEFLRPENFQGKRLTFGIPHFYALSARRKDRYDPWNFKASDLRSPSLMDDLWNKSDKNKLKLKWLGQALAGPPEIILGLYSGILNEAPEILTDDILKVKLARRLGIELNRLEQAIYLTMAHPWHAFYRLIQQKARWQAGMKQVNTLTGEKTIFYKGYNFPELIQTYFSNSVNGGHRILRKFEYQSWIKVLDKILNRTERKKSHLARQNSDGAWTVYR